MSAGPEREGRKAPEAEEGPGRGASTNPADEAAVEAARSLLPGGEGTLDRALELVAYLREHCPWDRKQTPRTLVPHLLEEAHETADAIRADDVRALEGELGDLLLNLAFQVVIGEEEGRFSAGSVVARLERKMIRRHPHLFGLGEKEDWERIKARERERARGGAAPGGPQEGVLDGLASGLDPLLRAHRIQERVSGVGFDWEEPSGALQKVREEVQEVAETLRSGDADALEDELGDMLFAVVNLVRLAGHHADGALTRANAKFQRRFEALEALARAREIDLAGASLQELDGLWEEVKREAAGEPDVGEG